MSLTCNAAFWVQARLQYGHRDRRNRLILKSPRTVPRRLEFELEFEFAMPDCMRSTAAEIFHTLGLYQALRLQNLLNVNPRSELPMGKRDCHGDLP